MPSGIVFDFSNMVGAGRLQAQEVEQALQQQGAAAEKAVCELRSTGFSKKHLSKDGRLNKVVQFLEVANPEEEAILHNPFADVPFFDKYEGMDMAKALKAALNANEAALTGDNRYNARFTLPKLNEYYLGQLMYFLMLTIAYEGELADVDAFDQPGVEVYKKLMKAQL